MKQMRDLPKDRELLSRFSREEASQALEDVRDILVATSEVWRREEEVHDLRTELSLHAPHSEDVTHQQNQENAGRHQHLTGLVQETQQRKMLTAQSTWWYMVFSQKSRLKNMDGLRRFITVDNQEALKVGDLENSLGRGQC